MRYDEWSAWKRSEINLIDDQMCIEKPALSHSSAVAVRIYSSQVMNEISHWQHQIEILLLIFSSVNEKITQL